MVKNLSNLCIPKARNFTHKIENLLLKEVFFSFVVFKSWISRWLKIKLVHKLCRLKTGDFWSPLPSFSSFYYIKSAIFNPPPPYRDDIVYGQPDTKFLLCCSKKEDYLLSLFSFGIVTPTKKKFSIWYLVVKFVFRHCTGGCNKRKKCTSVF